MNEVKSNCQPRMQQMNIIKQSTNNGLKYL